MTTATVTTTIAAPVEHVFRTLADVESFERAIPHVVGIEYLTDTRQGVGTRFRETRINNGSEATNELEITECVANDRIRMVTDSHGTIWDSLFSLRETPGGTELTVTMEAKAHQMMSKLTVPLVMPLVRGAMESDLEMVKQYCEQSAAAGDPASSDW